MTQQRTPKPIYSVEQSDRRVRARYAAEESPTASTDRSPDSLSPPDLDSADLAHLGLFFYAIPIFGFFPALWTLYRGSSDRESQAASRLAVTLALGWLIGYVLLETGARSTELLTIPLLLTSSLLTSSYFVVNIWLMVRLWQRRPLRLPGVSRIADRWIGKHLS